MSKKEAFWFCLLLTGVFLLNVGAGWRSVTFGLGAAICMWLAGRALRG